MKKLASLKKRSMRKLVIALVLGTVGALIMATMASAGGPAVHSVHVGSPDICDARGQQPGCDANFSLEAKEFADGSVEGQWQDAFGDGDRIHVAIDCLNVVGNGAVIGGVITNGISFGEDVSGQRVLTAVVDNGTSNNDPADQISFSFFLSSRFSPDLACDEQKFKSGRGRPHPLSPADFPLLSVPQGQTTVK